MRLSIVILAGGSASRFRGNKLLAHVPDSQPMLRRVYEQCKPLSQHITIVTGAYHNAVSELMDDDADLVFNERWQEGMASSIQTGVAHVQARHGGASHILMMLADLPLVTTQSLSVLAEVAALKPDMMVASYWDNRCTAPAIFPRRYWHQLQGLSGDSGAGRLLNSGMYAGPQETIAVPHPEAAFDIDTAGALKKLM